LLVAVGSDPDAVNSFLETGEGVGQRIFTGHEYDSDSNGLTYMGARYYSGEAGKLISQDPLFQLVGDKNFKVIAGYDQREYLANPQNSNSYSYAGNNPLKYVDPFGLDYYFNSSGQLVKDTGSGSKSYFENDDVKMLNQNASYMEQNKLNYAKFYDKVKTGGDWDYKQSERGFYFFKGELVDKYSFGNLNYGYTGTAGGFSKGLLTDMGGFVHIKNNTLESLSGNSVMANYDAPDDRSNVIKGVNSYFSSHNNLSTVTAKLQQLQYNLLGFPIAARMLGTAYCGLKSVPFLIKNSKW
ncbi:hypothetical protein JW977_01030, partial [Candidatus Falkowbacteria bacterium]|nr:hypothetical protein [Candidatus Falkowbacteria bacterium]